MTFKLGVVGSRSIKDEETFLNAIEQAPWLPIGEEMEVVSGGATGVDTLAEEWALERGIDVTIHKPNWDDWSDEHPAMKRNTDIVEDADAILAVWDGKSNGTRDSIDKALDRGKPLYVEVSER